MSRKETLNQIVVLMSGVAGLWLGLHSQVDAKDVSSTKLWDQTLRFQVSLMDGVK